MYNLIYLTLFDPLFICIYALALCLTYKLPLNKIACKSSNQTLIGRERKTENQEETQTDTGRACTEKTHR